MLDTQWVLVIILYAQPHRNFLTALTFYTHFTDEEIKFWEAGKGKKKKKNRFSRGFRKECSPADILILAQWDPCQTSDLWNYKKISLLCF